MFLQEEHKKDRLPGIDRRSKKIKTIHIFEQNGSFRNQISRLPVLLFLLRMQLTLCN